MRLLEIAQNQVRDLEQHHKRLDHHHDVMQRRVIELQALSDEKATIGWSRFTRDNKKLFLRLFLPTFTDKLMREISNHEANQMAATVEETRLKTIIQDQQTVIAGLEFRHDRVLEQYDFNMERNKVKISYVRQKNKRWRHLICMKFDCFADGWKK